MDLHCFSFKLLKTTYKFLLKRNNACFWNIDDEYFMNSAEHIFFINCVTQGAWKLHILHKKNHTSNFTWKKGNWIVASPRDGRLCLTAFTERGIYAVWSRYLLGPLDPGSKLHRPPGCTVYRTSVIRYHPFWIFSLGLSSYKLHLTSLLHPKSKISSLLSKVHYNKTILNFVVWYVQTLLQNPIRVLLNFQDMGPYPLKQLTWYKIYELCAMA